MAEPSASAINPLNNITLCGIASPNNRRDISKKRKERPGGISCDAEEGRGLSSFELVKGSLVDGVAGENDMNY